MSRRRLGRVSRWRRCPAEERCRPNRPGRLGIVQPSHLTGMIDNPDKSRGEKFLNRQKFQQTLLALKFRKSAANAFFFVSVCKLQRDTVIIP